MGRRSSHTPGELRRMILESSRKILEQDGINGLSARAIAKRIGYSPGTLYNVFRNLDDLLMTIQAATLDEAIETLRAVPRNGDARGYVKALSSAYIGFAMENRKLWNLLSQHNPPPEGTNPKLLDEKIEALVAVLRDAIQSVSPGGDARECEQTARTIWASMHGISAIAATDKTASLNSVAAPAYVAQLVEGFLCALESRER